MTTSITFETATIADAIRKAAKVAPTVRGMAFDQAAGLHMEIDPTAEQQLVLRATNIEMFSTEWITALSAEGKRTAWRLPSMALDRIVGTLPIGSGKTVTFTQLPDGKVEITSGRGLRCQFNGMNAKDYPLWAPFDPDELSPVPALGSRIKLVEWATATSDSGMALEGVHLDGEMAWGTDRTRAARMPCAIEHLDKPVTLPVQTISSILREGATAKLAVIGTQLCVMPDDWTQITVRTLANEYPVSKLKKSLNALPEQVVTVNRDELSSVIQRVVSIDLANRTPLVKIFLGNEEIAVFSKSDEVGLLRDIVECEGQLQHRRIEYTFNPKNLVDMLASAPEKQVRIGYNLDPIKSNMIYLQCGEYEAWVARVHNKGSGS